ncbi:cyclodeaminase/cyclohydrolase family protein [Flindersiella endophytica]
MHDITIGDFLEQLAAKVPAPGGGAAAALQAAQAAALLAMVGRYSQSPKYAEHAPTIERIIAEADERRAEALQLAAEDAEAFEVVSQAYRLPKDTPEQQDSRKQAIRSALVEAARPPAAVVAGATRLIELAEELLPIGNRNLLTDVAAAAAAASAAAITARVNVEVNLGSPPAADDGVDDLVARAATIVATVRREIAT